MLFSHQVSFFKCHLIDKQPSSLKWIEMEESKTYNFHPTTRRLQHVVADVLLMMVCDHDCDYFSLPFDFMFQKFKFFNYFSSPIQKVQKYISL